MKNLTILKTSITDRQFLEAIAYEIGKLQRCKVCDKFAHEDEIKFLHPLASNFLNEQERFMCSTCYNTKIDHPLKLLKRDTF